MKYLFNVSSKFILFLVYNFFIFKRKMFMWNVYIKNNVINVNNVINEY